MGECHEMSFTQEPLSEYLSEEHTCIEMFCQNYFSSQWHEERRHWQEKNNEFLSYVPHILEAKLLFADAELWLYCNGFWLSSLRKVFSNKSCFNKVL